MGLNTKIEYADSTWNPVRGCSKISEGCLNCFAEVWAKRYGHDFSKIVKSSDKTFYAPLKWKEPQVILVCDLGDLFHKDVPYDWAKDALEVIKKCPQHIFLLLTKRSFRNNIVSNALADYTDCKNIWLGVSVENQKAADERIPELLKIPHFKKWLSVEPMLDRINIRYDVANFNWVVCGGETGKGARYMCDIYPRELKNHCKQVGTPFFMKQMSNRQPIPKDLQIRQYPKEIEELNNAYTNKTYKQMEK